MWRSLAAGLGKGVAAWLQSPNSANLAAAVTDETGSGALVFGTSPTLTTPTVIGTSTNDSAAAGIVGEIISATITSSSAVVLASDTTANVTSISLTGGDWDVTATNEYIAGGAGATVNAWQASISFVSATVNSTPGNRNLLNFGTGALTLGAGTASDSVAPVVRVSIASTSSPTTVYLVARASFSAGALSVFGTIRGRRMR